MAETRDYLNVRLEPQEVAAVSNLGLAHIGDCVYELMVRSRLVCGGTLTNRSLHSATVEYVSAGAQARAARALSPHLTDEERAVYKRGRNTRVNSVPKRAQIGDYHAATGLECLFGWLYLNGRHDRLNELFSYIVTET